MLDELIVEFVASGFLGPLYLGARNAEVLERIGGPEFKQPWELANNHSKCETWKYGDLEVDLLDNKVFRIQLDFQSDGLSLHADYMSSWTISESLLIERTFRRMLATHELPMEVDDALTFDDQTVLRSPCGTRVGFSHGRLISIWRRADGL